MPDRVDSMSALMPAIFSLTCTEDCIMSLRQKITMHTKTGTMTSTTSARRHSTQNMTISAPMMVIVEIRRSSGPWCANSVISNRSPVSRFISLPVLLRSKKSKSSS